MAGLTFEALLNVDPKAFRTAATGWDDLAQAIDDRADALDPTVKRIPDIWEGPAGTKASAHLQGLRKELDLAYVPVLTISQALSRHADGVESLRSQAHSLVARGKEANVTIKPDGSMTLDPAGQNEWGARALSALVHERDELMEAAAQLDSQTAKTISENTATGSGVPAARVDRTSIPPKGSDPKAVKAWWDSLSPAQQRFVLAEYPELVGNLDGVPVASRDIANRIVLDRDHDALNTRRGEVDAREAYIRRMIEEGRGAELYPNAGNPVGEATAELDRLKEERSDIDGKLRGIDKISDRIDDDGSDRPRGFLIGFSSEGDGKAIVSAGNPDDADNVVTYVPGTGTDLSKVGGDLERVDRMVHDANRLEPGEDTAGIMWFGYDAPDDIPAATLDRYAEDGAGDLRNFQSGLRATHEGESSHNVVLGHSYGTTVIGQTASEQAGLNADDLVLVASPGAEVGGAKDLNITGGDPTKHVWATTAKNDFIQNTGLEDNLVHGENPVGAGFGGQVFKSDEGTPLWEWQDPFNAPNFAAHSEYWDPNNEARKNIASIVTSNYGDVTR
ncbi:alpha/beta hydrolase [Plantactinospora soyae]|uniref:Uncharacterized protein YukE n=1 Tax=Plantactinospora soyae TaxID=1544732 RepID=A0A927QYM4_9ACTN|nr:alpha/beta hydrolase [Plantactinospora soyae]MBE1486703.1 uncharacterized protein YukE [Plantactinospora soyae]